MEESLLGAIEMTQCYAVKSTAALQAGHRRRR